MLMLGGEGGDREDEFKSDGEYMLNPDQIKELLSLAATEVDDIHTTINLVSSEDTKNMNILYPYQHDFSYSQTFLCKKKKNLQLKLDPREGK